MTDVSYNDFAKLEIRVAKIISAQPIKGKDRILKGRIDLGASKNGDVQERNEQNVIIGGAQYFEPDDIIGMKVIAITNLETKNIAGVESNAMLLAADVNDKPFWLTVSDEVPAGSQVR